MITTNSKELYQKLLLLRTHGITKETALFQNTIEFADGCWSIPLNPIPETYPGWYYEMQELGFNYRLTDFQAALGLSQLKRADEGLNKRKEIALKYYNEFRNKPFIKGQSGYSDENAYHLYIIEVEDRRGLYEHLRKNKIFAQIHYIPVHLMPYYRQFGWKEGDLINAEAYYRDCLSLPMFPTLSDKEQDFVIKTISSHFEG